MPLELLKELPGYDPDVEKNRAQARQIMQKLGYGPDKSLPIKVSTRDLPPFRNPAVLLIDQLKQIYIVHNICLRRAGSLSIDGLL